jgi:uncharacterized protein YozE (UPF0346 family)
MPLSGISQSRPHLKLSKLLTVACFIGLIANSHLSLAQSSCSSVLTEVTAGQAIPHLITVNDENAKLFSVRDFLFGGPKTDELTASEQFLKNHGIEWKRLRVDNDEVLLIKPSERSDWGSFALKIKQAYDCDLVIWPKKLLALDATGAALSWNYGGQKKPLIAIGEEALLKNQNPLRDKVILHELRHVKFEFGRLSKEESPFIGAVKSQGTIPDDTNPSIKAYSKYLSFEEIRTFRTDAKMDLFKLKKQIQNGEKISEISEDIKSTFSDLVYNNVTLERTTRSVEMAIDYLEKNGAIEFVINTFSQGSYITAEFTNVLCKTGVLSFSIPLLKSTGANDPRNPELLKNQLQWTLTSAKAAHANIDQAKAQILELNDYAGNEQHLLEIIDQIQFSLDPLLSSHYNAH